MAGALLSDETSILGVLLDRVVEEGCVETGMREATLRLTLVATSAMDGNGLGEHGNGWRHRVGERLWAHCVETHLSGDEATVGARRRRSGGKALCPTPLLQSELELAVLWAHGGAIGAGLAPLVADHAAVLAPATLSVFVELVGNRMYRSRPPSAGRALCRTTVTALLRVYKRACGGAGAAAQATKLMSRVAARCEALLCAYFSAHDRVLEAICGALDAIALPDAVPQLAAALKGAADPWLLELGVGWCVASVCVCVFLF